MNIKITSGKKSFLILILGAKYKTRYNKALLCQHKANNINKKYFLKFLLIAYLLAYKKIAKAAICLIAFNEMKKVVEIKNIKTGTIKFFS